MVFRPPNRQEAGGPSTVLRRNACRCKCSVKARLRRLRMTANLEARLRTRFKTTANLAVCPRTLPRKILQLRIHPCDQRILLCTTPSFQLFLARDGLLNPFIDLEVNELIAVVVLRESAYQLGLVLPDARFE